ncbi:MAG TPA: XrtB/PEP-CTERM-associated transcriptional regulator EpsA [Burkholderiales bacterium]|nr:XrtB/PEP-CTERM-associated transcriptional regulator EpsA [Burkholderiales bacterium]
MQPSDQTFTAEQRRPQRALAARSREARADAGTAALLEPLELEALTINMDASLRVYARHQLFGWAQGMLQNLVKHELLICALRNGEPPSYQVDSFAGPAFDPALIGDLFRHDTALVPQIIKTWEDGQYRPVFCDAGAGGALAAELKRTGAQALVAHGTYDSFGKPASLFIFAGAPAEIGARQGFLVELIVPFLHLAWLRTRINRPLDGSDAPQRAADLLTVREQEILRWIHIGKSNIEIGTILDISPLTVKNHVQKILRKLNVQNRTQAVGKALALRILNI